MVLEFRILNVPPVAAADSLAVHLSGRLLLQAQDRGQVWYVNPVDGRRYEVNADNALAVFQTLALGITNADLDKIPTHSDGARAVDSDNDGYTDDVEAAHGYNLFGPGRARFDSALAKRLRGRLLLQVQNSGRVWYVNPLDGMKYELTAASTLTLFRRLALGITNEDLHRIVPTATQPMPVASVTPVTPRLQTTPPTQPPVAATPLAQPATSATALATAASALRAGEANATAYFTPAVRSAVAYTVNALDGGSLLLLGNLLSSATPTNANESEATYTTVVAFNGHSVTIDFRLQKQLDGSWLLTNL